MARRSAPSARHRSSIPHAPCASGARHWCSAPTSTFPYRKMRSLQPLRRFRGRTRSAPTQAREQALIAALATRYTQEPKTDRAPLDAAYAAAMGKLAADFPDDNEIALLYAEAVMDLSPWNYWQPGGHEPNPQSAPIVPTLERVLAKEPNHPGAIHFYIHAVEASDRPQRAEPH